MINVDAFDFSGVVRKESLESKQVVALDEQISGVRIAGGQAVFAPQKPVRHFPVMVDYRLLSDPIKRGHKFLLSNEGLTYGLMKITYYKRREM